MKTPRASNETIPPAFQAVRIHRGKAVDRAQKLQQIARERQEFDEASDGLAGRHDERDDKLND